MRCPVAELIEELTRYAPVMRMEGFRHGQADRLDA